MLLFPYLYLQLKLNALELTSFICAFFTNLKPTNILPVFNFDSKLDCTYLDIWVKIKICAIINTSAPINMISTCFAKKLGIALDLDYCKEFGIAGIQSITA